jgi:hypothetical protein
MVRALLEGRKTQTRRALSNQDVNVGVCGVFRASKRLGKYIGEEEEFKCPYGQPGDLLYVRENMKEDCAGSISFAQYSADDVTTKHEWWKPVSYCPSIHMPRRLSRLTLKITDVRVERVQDISNDAAIAEGIERRYERKNGAHFCISNPRCDFAELWDSINEMRGFGWDRNPWVWVVEFEVIHKNVDEVNS